VGHGVGEGDETVHHLSGHQHGAPGHGGHHLDHLHMMDGEEVHMLTHDLFVYLYYSVDFSIVVLYCIAMQPGTRISCMINKVLSYLI